MQLRRVLSRSRAFYPFAVCLFAACGGGDGGGTTTPPTPDVQGTRLAMQLDPDTVTVTTVGIDVGTPAMAITYPVVSDFVQGSVQLPANGTPVPIVLRAFDAQGVLRNEGSVEVTVPRTGLPPSVVATLHSVGDGPDMAVTVATRVLRANPRRGWIFAGDRLPLGAEILESSGKSTPVANPVWKVLSGAGSITPDGVFVPSDTGIARVQATFQGEVSTAVVRTLPAPYVIAHRGFAMRYPENTMPAFLGSLAQGASALETDVQFTRDSVPVIMHDAAVDRTTNGHGAVSSMTLAELRTLNACEKADTRCQVPTLAEFLEMVRGRTRAYVEIKPTLDMRLMNRVMDVVERSGAADSVVMTSTIIANLQLIRRRNQTIRTGVIDVVFPSPERYSTPELILSLAPVELLIDQKGVATSPASVRWFAAHGVPTAGWTVRSAGEVWPMALPGVRAFISDIPLGNLGAAPLTVMRRQ